jgi:hypothetical protein
VTAGSRRIAQAVDDEEWQKFRVSMKGKTTEVKLVMLDAYWGSQHSIHAVCWIGFAEDLNSCDICIRVDNYIKALCRGGQLYAGESLHTALNAQPRWNLRIKR